MVNLILEASRTVETSGYDEPTFSQNSVNRPFLNFIQENKMQTTKNGNSNFPDNIEDVPGKVFK